MLRLYIDFCLNLGEIRTGLLWTDLLERNAQKYIEFIWNFCKKQKYSKIVMSKSYYKF